MKENNIWNIITSISTAFIGLSWFVGFTYNLWRYTQHGIKIRHYMSIDEYIIQWSVMILGLIMRVIERGMIAIVYAICCFLIRKIFKIIKWKKDITLIKAIKETLLENINGKTKKNLLMMGVIIWIIVLWVVEKNMNEKTQIMQAILTVKRGARTILIMLLILSYFTKNIKKITTLLVMVWIFIVWVLWQWNIIEKELDAQINKIEEIELKDGTVYWLRDNSIATYLGETKEYIFIKNKTDWSIDTIPKREIKSNRHRNINKTPRAITSEK